MKNKKGSWLKLLFYGWDYDKYWDIHCKFYNPKTSKCEAANCQRRKLHDRIGSFPFLTAQLI